MIHLYYKTTCAYSRKVLATAESLGITLNLKDIGGDEVLRSELIEKGGKLQVPYLEDTDHNVAMYESNDIVAYLHKQYGNGEAPTQFNGLRIHRNDETCEVCE